MNKVGAIGHALIVTLSVFIIISPIMPDAARLVAALVLCVGSYSRGDQAGTTHYRAMLQSVLSESTLDRVVSDMKKAADRQKEK